MGWMSLKLAIITLSSVIIGIGAMGRERSQKTVFKCLKLNHEEHEEKNNIHDARYMIQINVSFSAI
jgi:hypothetical protein